MSIKSSIISLMRYILFTEKFFGGEEGGEKNITIYGLKKKKIVLIEIAFSIKLI